eukprot:TRINITY_DN151_c0_g1_i2.p1 TRINITY_DN151_c0_g1~~TRINITY_DN151_c0_g1_i2.p1  ORF type:complete len:1405 (-),score=390.15 TRINITY_DN151_c0_g1_i2:123-4337(-)
MEVPEEKTIDVDSSIKQFQHTNKELNNDLKKEEEIDIEKNENFDLRAYFENSVRNSLHNGSNLKKMGVSINNLTVVGEGAQASTIQDLTSPIVWFASLLNPVRWFKKSQDCTFDILHDVNGFVKEGEMMLVLGRPGSGCSSLLRVIANQRSSYIEVKGQVTYGGVPAEDFGKYLGEAIYLPEEDSHFPQLSVKQTLSFALKNKTPGNRLKEDTKKSFRTKTADLLLTMFGMKKQAETMVGNEFIRGLSGGERKRMSIMEAMTVSPAITCWDSATRGLDAASALDYAKSLRVITDTMKKTTVATFYQASESIYELFDKIMVLEKGRVIYFGPPQKAKEYFYSLGFDCESRKSTPDFLTGVTNFQERKIREGFEDKVPLTSYELEESWKNSNLFREMREEQKKYEQELEAEQPFEEFKKEVLAEKSKGARSRSKYTVSPWQQVKALITRQFQLVWMDKADLVVRYTSVLIQSLIYSSVFYNITDNTAGGITRGSALFSALLMNAFLSEAEVISSFMGRTTLQRHKSYAMYHPSIFHLAQVVMDIPLIFGQTFIFCIISYFMYGLSLTAGQFFVYLFTIYMVALCLANMFRMFGYLNRSVHVAQQLSTLASIILIAYSGFLITYPKMKPWFGWVFWINPIAYGFKAIFSNEMRSFNFQCSGPEGVIPFGPTYTDPAYQTCALKGATPGTLSYSGRDFLASNYGFDVDDQAISVIAVFLFWILITLINMIAVEFFELSSGGHNHKVYKRGKAPKIKSNEEEKELQLSIQAANDSMKNILTITGGTFLWKNINYVVPVKGGNKMLLDDVEGWIKPGQMTALMGSSGAGKTTLLDVLARRKTIGTVSGTILLNGKPLKIDFERITGYVEQMDVHNPGCTVRESLQFSAKLRQENSISNREKMEYVEQILEMMEMKHLGDALIGDLESGIGISVEERKRLTIGIELVAKPHLLFLDEPTSGLDAQSSYNIVKFIKKLAHAGMPLVCTIHQPSSILFEHFDRLLLLAKGGKTVYFGDIGEHSKILTGYFERNGVRPCTDNENPAEYILEAIGAGVNGSTDKDWNAIWKSSPESIAVQTELENVKIEHEEEKEEPKEYATSLLYQFWMVYKRMNLVYWRDPPHNFGRLIQATFFGLLTGFSYYNLSNSTSDLQYRILCIFTLAVLGMLVIFEAMPTVFQQRQFFQRDYSSKIYSWIPFGLSLVLVELPYLVVSATLAMAGTYWAAGLDSTALDGFYFWITYIVFFMVCVSLGQAMGAIFVNIFQAFLITPLVSVFLFLFCGALQAPSQMPRFWIFVYHVNPFRYFMEGIVTSVLHTVKIECAPDDFITVQPPAGSTCGQYMADYLTTAVGYLGNPEATANCQYCQFSQGSDFFETIPWSYNNAWRNLGILFAYLIFNIGLVTIFVWVFRKPRR